MNRVRSLKTLSVIILLTIGSAAAHTDAAHEAKIVMGNGENNKIEIEGVTRNGGTLTFSEVQIDGDGWLVIHPFENGAPNGDKYVAATFVKDGTNKDVSIKVHKGLATGEMMIVLLHSDLNKNGVLDFVFVDDENVMDRAVFEGSTMIGHVVSAP